MTPSMSVVMRNNERSTRARKVVWRNGMIGLALAGTGLVTAMAAADIGKISKETPEAALSRTIARQRVAAAQPATAPPPAGGAAAPSEAETRAAIIAEANRAEAELNNTIMRLEGLKKSAYDAKDLIKVGVVAAKVDEVRLLQSMIQPVIDSMRQPGVDLFTLRAKLTTIRQGMEQARKAAADAESSQGDSFDTSGAALDLGAGRDSDNGITDPQSPANPTTDGTIDRPPNASPYR